MRLISAFVVAVCLVFVIFWVGARVAAMVEQPHREHNDFTVGEKMSLCGHIVDTRHMVSGYNFDEWQGRRCELLSNLDICLLECLSEAGTVEIGAACFSNCVSE
jgi:hypothetical protein